MCTSANMHGPRRGMHASNARGESSPYSRGGRDEGGRRCAGARERRVVSPGGHPGRSRLTSDLSAFVFP